MFKDAEPRLTSSGWSLKVGSFIGSPRANPLSRFGTFSPSLLCEGGELRKVDVGAVATPSNEIILQFGPIRPIPVSALASSLRETALDRARQMSALLRLAPREALPLVDGVVPLYCARFTENGVLVLSKELCDVVGATLGDEEAFEQSFALGWPPFPDKPAFEIVQLLYFAAAGFLPFADERVRIAGARHFIRLADVLGTEDGKLAKQIDDALLSREKIDLDAFLQGLSWNLGGRPPADQAEPERTLPPQTDKTGLEKARPSPDETRPSSGNARPSPDAARPSSGNARPSPDETRPLPGDACPFLGNARPLPEDARPPRAKEAERTKRTGRPKRAGRPKRTRLEEARARLEKKAAAVSFWRRKGPALIVALAVVAAAAFFAGNFLAKQFGPPPTAALGPEAIVARYYEAQSLLDMEALTDSLALGASSPAETEVAALHVARAARLGYENFDCLVSPESWEASGRGPLEEGELVYGTRNLEIERLDEDTVRATGLLYKSGGSEREGFTTVLVFRQVEDFKFVKRRSWLRIGAITTVEASLLESVEVPTFPRTRTPLS